MNAWWNTRNGQLTAIAITVALLLMFAPDILGRIFEMAVEGLLILLSFILGKALNGAGYILETRGDAIMSLILLVIMYFILRFVWKKATTKSKK